MFNHTQLVLIFAFKLFLNNPEYLSIDQLTEILRILGECIQRIVVDNYAISMELV